MSLVLELLDCFCHVIFLTFFMCKHHDWINASWLLTLESGHVLQNISMKLLYHFCDNKHIICKHLFKTECFRWCHWQALTIDYLLVHITTVSGIIQIYRCSINRSRVVRCSCKIKQGVFKSIVAGCIYLSNALSCLTSASWYAVHAQCLGCFG